MITIEKPVTRSLWNRSLQDIFGEYQDGQLIFTIPSAEVEMGQISIDDLSVDQLSEYQKLVDGKQNLYNI